MTRANPDHDRPDRSQPWKPPERIDPLVVETPRLVVRPYALEDVSAVFDAVNESRDVLLPWMQWAERDHRSLAATAKYVSSQILALADPPSLGRSGAGVAIVDRRSGLFLGATGFHDLRPETASAETGYWIRSTHRKRGLCTEAMRHWLSWLLRPQADGGFGLARVRIFCSSANAASQRIPQKLGLRQEVHQRREDLVPGLGITDRLGWGVLADEWDCARHTVKTAR